MENSAHYTDLSKLHSFFNTALSELYWSEKHLRDVFHSMKEAAFAPSLEEAFTSLLEQTQHQFSRLEQVYQLLEQPAGEKQSPGLQGLFDEGWSVIDEINEKSFQRDIALLAAAQKAKHYKIASYNSLINLAKVLDLKKKIVDLFVSSLKEEKESATKFDQLEEQPVKASSKKVSAPKKPAAKKTKPAPEPEAIATSATTAVQEILPEPVPEEIAAKPATKSKAKTASPKTTTRKKTS